MSSVSIIGPALNGIIPVICVTLAGLACMLAEAFRQRGERMPIGGLGVIGLIGAAAAVVLLWGRRAESFGVVRADDFGLFVQLVLIGVGLLTIVFSPKAIDRDGLPAGEYYALTLFAVAGMMLMAVATDLLVIFLALEVFSLALYVLTGLRRQEYSSTEGAFKYFVLGGFASAFFLYGIAFTYGLAGSTHLDRVASAVQAQALSGNPLLLVAMGLLLVGLAFKVAAVPFHMWTPDAYEAAPTMVTGFMSTAVKAAALRRVRARVPAGPRAAARRVDTGAVGARGVHDDPRVGGRGGPDEPQAHARLLEHRARRVPAGRPRRRATRWAGRRSCSTSWSMR